MIVEPGTYDLEITASTLGVAHSGNPLWNLMGKIITEGPHFNEVVRQHYVMPDVLSHGRSVGEVAATEARNEKRVVRIRRVLTALNVTDDVMQKINSAVFDSVRGQKMTVDLEHHQLTQPSRTIMVWTNERPWRDWDARMAEMTTAQLEDEYKKQFDEAERLMNEADAAAVRARLVRARLAALRSAAA